MAYDANSIKKMEFPVTVQKRPSMYMGSQAKNPESPGQKNVAVREILDNATTEALRGKADHVTITFHKNGSVSILDNGRGIPTDVNKETGKNGIMMTMAELHSGGNFEGVEEGKAGAGLNGVGGACVNALSSRFDVEVYKGKFVYKLSFQDGYPGQFDDKGNFKPSDKIIREKFDHEQGTLINFTLDDKYFADVENIIIDDIIDRCRYIVYIIPNLKIDIIDETRSKEEGGGTYHFEDDTCGGISGMVDFISTGNSMLSVKENEFTEKGIFSISTVGKYKKNYVDISSGKSEVKEKVLKIPIDVAFRFNEDDKSEVMSFVNTINTHRGGIVEEALKEALMDTFGKEAMK